MAGAPSDPSPEVVPSQQTHTPTDHRAQALSNAQANTEDLHLRRQHTTPLVDQLPQTHSGSKGGNPTGSARQRARGVNRDIINDARMQLPQEFRAGQNIAAAAILLQTLPELQDPA